MNTRWGKYALVVVVVVVVLVLTREILAPFILAGVTAYVLIPVVDRAQRMSRLPRVAVIALFYLLFIGGLTLVIVLIEPSLARQTTGQHGLFKSGVGVADSALDLASRNQQAVILLQRVGVDIVPFDDPQYPEKKAILARRLQGEIDRATQPGRVTAVAQTTFGVLLKIVIWFFASFYLLLNGRRAANYLYRFVPDERVEQIQRMMRRIHIVLGRYLRGQLYLIVIMSVVSYIALRIFHVPYALPIAIGTGILEIIPFVGPIIAGTIASLVALSTHGVGTMVGIIIVYFVLREIEDQIVIPQIIGRVVHLDPVVTIFVVLAGERLAGIVGVLLAVPLAAATRVVIDELYPPKVLTPEPIAAPESGGAEGTLPVDDAAGGAEEQPPRRWPRRRPERGQAPEPADTD